MNAKKLVKATNIIGMVAVTLLVYWVFALILIQVFGLRCSANTLQKFS